MLKSGVLDPQGRAIAQALHGLGFTDISDVRAGKVFEIYVSETDPAIVQTMAESMARKLLVNAIMETFHITVEQIPP